MSNKKLASNFPLHDAARLGDIISLQALLKRPAKVNQFDKNGYTPLHYAAHYGYVKVVMLLLQKGAKHLSTTMTGVAPLHLAVRNDNFEMVRMLLQKGANPDICNKNKRTPLHIAAFLSCSTSIIKILVQSGANLYAHDSNEAIPLHIALSWKRSRIAACLAKLSLKEKQAMTVHSQEMRKALLIAAKEGVKSVLALLLQKIPPRSLDDLISTLTHALYDDSQLAILSTWINQTDDINIQDKNGESLLFHLIRQRRTRLIKMFLNEGGSIDLKNNRGDTALHVAAKEGKRSLVKALLVYKASISCKNNNGQTPLDVALPATAPLLTRKM